MNHIFARVLLCAAALAFLPVSGIADSLLPVSPIADPLWPVAGTADPPAQCNANFTSCLIPENVLLRLPSLTISGDVILLDTQTKTVSDVFRIFNNFVDTARGTGLGDLAFLYSSDDSTPLPNPATYSANAVTIMEDLSGSTHYLGNGKDYLLNPVPEPGTFGSLVLGIGLMALFSRKRRIS
jgi:hypothetical protein